MICADAAPIAPLSSRSAKTTSSAGSFGASAKACCGPLFADEPRDQRPDLLGGGQVGLDHVRCPLAADEGIGLRDVAQTARRAKYDTATSNEMLTDRLANTAGTGCRAARERRRPSPGSIAEPHQPVMGTAEQREQQQAGPDHAAAEQAGDDAIAMGAPPKEPKSSAGTNCATAQNEIKPMEASGSRWADARSKP